MDFVSASNFARDYLADQVEDNYQRFLIIPFITGCIGLLFVLKNTVTAIEVGPTPLNNAYFATWSALVIFSLIFRMSLPRLKQTQSIYVLDFAMFIFATLMCFVAASASALASQINSDFTAYAYTVLGTATAYRASTAKYLLINLLTFGYFNFVYFHLIGEPFSIGFLLPIIALCTISMFITASLENNRKRTMQLSRELEQTNKRLKEETIRDPLTKLYNRRYLVDFLQREIKEFSRSKECFCLAVCDIDYFKKINDNLGHLIGDKALQQFSDLLKQYSRSTDILIRFGGEEFVIVMPRTDIDAAFNVIERIKKTIENNDFNGVDWQVTASFGLTEIREYDTDNLLLARADDLLYQAKTQGRNRIICDGLRHSSSINNKND